MDIGPAILVALASAAAPTVGLLMAWRTIKRDGETAAREMGALVQRVATLEAAMDDVVRRAVCLSEMGRLGDRIQACQPAPRDRVSSS